MQNSENLFIRQIKYAQKFKFLLFAKLNPLKS